MLLTDKTLPIFELIHAKMTRLVDWEQQGVTHQGLAVFIRGARISDILYPNSRGKLFADDLTAMVPLTWTPVFVWLTSAEEVIDAA